MRRSNRIARTFLACLALAALPAALAQGPAAGSAQTEAEAEAEAPPLPRYRVELIFFAHNNATTTGEDLFHGIDNPDAPPAPDLLRVPDVELETLFGYDPFAAAGPNPAAQPVAPPVDTVAPAPVPGASAPGAPGDPNAVPTTLPALPADRLEMIGSGMPPAHAAAGAPDVPPAFRTLRADELELTDIYSMLRRVPRYRVIAHTGFEQAGVAESAAIPIDLGRLGITNPEGSVTLWLGRYLHVGVDLEFYEAAGTRWIARPGPGLAPLDHARAYRLVAELNAIRSSDDPRYIDHPLYGVLVIVRPAPEPEPTIDAGTEAGPAA